jgi:predicted transcriptional regulator
MASGKEPAKYRDIECVADGINHAIPTQKEIRASITWLISEGLVQSQSKKYSLSLDGKELLERLSKNINTTMGVWKNIEKHFSDQGIDNKNELNPNTLTI